MHIVVIFINIGSYHAARLRATYAAYQSIGWHLTALQVTDNTLEHPWGDLEREITFPLQTILPKAIAPTYSEDRAVELLPTILDRLQPDIVAIPGWGFSISQAALSWCQRRRVPTVLMSESKWDDEKRFWWKEQLKSWLYVSKYDAALVGGELHREYLVRLGMPRDRIFLGYDAVDNDYFACGAEVARRDPVATRRRRGIPTKPYFIAATRLLERKNIMRLVTAFAAYRQQIGEDRAWDLVICGSGDRETAIRCLILELGLENCVHLPGFVSYEAIADWYGLAQVFVHPALQEQWGLVVNEACAAGLPILCSRTVGASRELVHSDRNGWLFAPEDEQAIARHLIAIHQLNESDRIRMGQSSQKIVANYGCEKFATGLIDAAKACFVKSQFSKSKVKSLPLSEAKG